MYLLNSGHAGQNTELDSQWVADGSYLRGNLFQIGYRFSENQLAPLNLTSLRVFASLNNAFVIHSKRFLGYDPEGSSQGGNQWGQNMFFFQYPKPRTFTVGINLVF